MTISPGGHAIMIRIKALSQDLVEIQEAWIKQKPDTRKKPENLAPHITLAFLGRDLDLSPIQTAGLHTLGQGMANLIEHPLTTRGDLDMFGGKKDTLVAHIEQTGALLETRRQVTTWLETLGLKATADFGGVWKPHVTLAVGEPKDQVYKGRTRGLYLLQEAVEVKIGKSVHHYPMKE